MDGLRGACEFCTQPPPGLARWHRVSAHLGGCRVKRHGEYATVRDLPFERRRPPSRGPGGGFIPRPTPPPLAWNETHGWWQMQFLNSLGNKHLEPIDPAEGTPAFIPWGSAEAFGSTRIWNARRPAASRPAGRFRRRRGGDEGGSFGLRTPVGVARPLWANGGQSRPRSPEAFGIFSLGAATAG